MIATFSPHHRATAEQAIFFGVAASFAIFAYNESSTAASSIVVSADGIPSERPAPGDLLPSRAVTHLAVQGNLFLRWCPQSGRGHAAAGGNARRGGHSPSARPDWSVRSLTYWSVTRRPFERTTVF
ncbi:MAG: hypothetical protein U0452_12345 [Anaerolineae bacterium]